MSDGKSRRCTTKPIEVETITWDGSPEGIKLVTAWIADRGGFADYNPALWNGLSRQQGISVTTAHGTAHCFPLETVIFYQGTFSVQTASMFDAMYEVNEDSPDSGEWVSKEYAEANPRTTVYDSKIDRYRKA